MFFKECPLLKRAVLLYMRRNMRHYLAIDDTDIEGTRGTGRLARQIAGSLGECCAITGITRHQLFVHPGVPYTSHNSCAVIHIESSGEESAVTIFSRARDLVLEDFIEGSDPGICIATQAQVTPDLIAYGQRAKSELLGQDEARALARTCGIRLEGLGGTEDGVIGALAGIGLAASENDGRFVQRGKLRQIRGVQPVNALLAAGIDGIVTSTGEHLSVGEVRIRKFPKPALLGGRAVLFVEATQDGYTDIVRG
jgi:hypothetical protein